MTKKNVGDVNPHAQCLKLSKGEKNGSKTKLNSCFHVLQDGLFTSCYAFSEAGTPATTLLKAGSSGPGFCGTAFCLSTLECA